MIEVETNTSTDRDGCVEQMSPPSPTATTSITTNDELIIGVSQHQALFDQEDQINRTNPVPQTP